MLQIENGIPLKVDGQSYMLTVQDFGSHWKVRVYQNGRVLGFHDFPFRVSIDQRVMTYTVRSVLREQNEKDSIR